MIILPTIYRPDNLRRFIRHYQLTQAVLPVHVVFDAVNVFQYREVTLPPHWKRCTVPTGSRLGDIFTLVFREFPHEDFYGMVADDIVPETAQWDITLRDACLPDKIAWGFDGGRNEMLPRHPFIGGALVRRLGFWSAPGLKHWFIDNAWRDIAEELNCGAYLPDVHMRHHHYTNGLAQKDRTYESQPSTQADEIAYQMWRRMRVCPV